MDDQARQALHLDVAEDAPRGDADPRRTDRDTQTSSQSWHDRPDAEDTGSSRPWVRTLGFIAGGIVLLALIVGGLLWWLHARHFETTDDAFIDGYTTQLSPQVSGRVTALMFADNEHVTAGQTLLTTDPRDYQVKLDQAKGQQASASAQLVQARAQLVVRQADLAQAQANVRASEADLTQARQDFDRYNALGPHAVSRQQIDNAAATLRSSQAKLDANRQAVDGAKAQVEAAQAAILAAQAAVQQANANVEEAELQLSYCTVSAPVSGTVGHRTVDVGNYVNPGQPLFAIVQDTPWVTANFKETQLAAMHPGQPVEITADAIPGVTFHGRIDSFQPGTGTAFSVLPAENATGNYVKMVQRVPVKIVFDDPQVRHHHLLPGMSVEPVVRVR